MLTRSASGASLLAEWAAGDTLRTVRMRDWFIGLNVVDKMFLRLPALVSRVWSRMTRLPIRGEAAKPRADAPNPGSNPDKE